MLPAPDGGKTNFSQLLINHIGETRGDSSANLAVFEVVINLQ